MIIRDFIIKEHRVLTEAQARAQLMEDPVFRQFRSIGRYITERKMTDSEILQVFADVEAGMTDKATGANRTLAGSTKDTAMDFAGGVKDAYDSIINSIQSNATVAAVDVAYNEATDALAKVAGGQNGAVMNAIKKYRMLAKEYPKTAGFAKAALVAIAGLATGGAGLPIIAGLTYALDSAIKGDKLSSVIGKGAGAAALSYVGQAAYGAYGGQAGAGAGVGDGTAMGDTTPSISGGQDIGGYNPDNVPGDLMTTPEPGWQSNADVSGMYAQEPGWPGSGAEGGTTDYTAVKGDTLSNIAEKNGVSVKELADANGIDYKDVHDIKVGQTLKIPGETGSAVYDQGVGAGGPGSDTSSAGTNNFRADNMNRMADKFDAEYYRDKPDDFGINPRSNDAVGTGMPGSASSQGFTGTSVAGMPVIPGQPLNPTQMAVSDMAIKMGNRLSPVVQAAYDLAKSGAVRESSWSKVAESVKFKTLPVDRLIDDRITILSWALNESIGRKSKSINLTTVGVYTVFENIDRYRKAILGERLPSTEVGPGREQLPDYGRPDAPGAPAPVTPAAKKGLFGKGLDWVNKAAGKVGGALGTLGHQFTTNVTKEKLKMNWQIKGRPSESDQLSAWLVTQGVPQQVITTVYNKMGIPHTAPAATPAPASPTPSATPTGTTAPTSTGGTVTQTSTGQVHRARADNPNAAVANPATAAPTTATAPVATPGAPAAANVAGYNDPKSANYVGRREVARRQAAQPAAAAATPNFAGPSGYGKTTMTTTGINPRHNYDEVTGKITPFGAARKAKRDSETAAFNASPKGKALQTKIAQWDAEDAAAAAAPGKQPTNDTDAYVAGVNNAEADRRAMGANRYNESLSWSRNFNPGMTLFRQMKREQS